MIIAFGQGVWGSLLVTFLMAIVNACLRSALAALETLPGLLAKCLASEEGDHVVQEFMNIVKSRFEDWQAASCCSDAWVKQKAEESPWEHPVAQEIASQGMSDNWGARTAHMCYEIAENCFQLGQTKMIEDSFQRLRDAESRHNASRVLSLIKTWVTPIQRRVLNSVHKYDEMSYKECPISRAAQLPSKVPSTYFQVRANKPVVNLHGISSKGNATWKTCTALSGAKDFAHMALFAHCRSTGVWELAESCWFSCLLPAGTLCRRKCTQQWFMSLGDVEHAAVLLWGVEIGTYDGDDFFRPRGFDSRIPASYYWDVVLNTGADFGWEVLPVSWCGPAYFAAHRKRAMMSALADAGEPGKQPAGHGPPFKGVMARKVGEPVGPLQAAAKEAFYNINFETFKKLAKVLRIATPDGVGTIFKVLVALITEYLPTITEVELLKILDKRRLQQHVDAEFYYCDAIQAAFSESDLKEVSKT